MVLQVSSVQLDIKDAESELNQVVMLKNLCIFFCSQRNDLSVSYALTGINTLFPAELSQSRATCTRIFSVVRISNGWLWHMVKLLRLDLNIHPEWSDHTCTALSTPQEALREPLRSDHSDHNQRWQQNHVILMRVWDIFVRYFKAKLSPKCNLGFFCECTRVRPLCKSIYTIKAALLRFTVFLFLGQTHFHC